MSDMKRIKIIFALCFVASLCSAQLVKHHKVNYHADGTDTSVVRPSDWNAALDVDTSSSGLMMNWWRYKFQPAGNYTTTSDTTIIHNEILFDTTQIYNYMIASLSLKKNSNDSTDAKTGYTTNYQNSLKLNKSTFDLMKNAFLEVKFGSGSGGSTNYQLAQSFKLVDFSNLYNYTLTDIGSNYNATTNQYKTPVAGIYKKTTKIRMCDGIGTGWGYGQGADTTLRDSPAFGWAETVVNRNGNLNVSITHYNQGQHILMQTYGDRQIKRQTVTVVQSFMSISMRLGQRKTWFVKRLLKVYVEQG